MAATRIPEFLSLTSAAHFALEAAIRVGGDAGGAKVVAQKPGQFFFYAHGDAFAPGVVVLALGFYSIVDF